MKKIFFFAAIASLSIYSCRKDIATSTEQQPTEIERTSTNSVRAVPINWDTTLYMPDGVSMFNTCTQEYINFSGSVHIHIRGVISDNKITWIGHYDVQNVKGVGQITGTKYVTTETFNFSSTDNFNSESIEYQQRYSLHYVSLGKTSNFTLVNNWHLTINANGDVSFYFSTEGDIIQCQE
jgi:hypothetical protein